jgi:alpha-tubulin suppressor-like RCC1 family protein
LGSPNYGGMLGDSTVNNRSVPTPVVGGLAFASLSANGTVTCGITTAGALYCWGIQNSSVGILGDGSLGDIQYLAPHPMSGNLAFVSIAVEEFHACGIVAGGAAYCWGGNPNGELGNGTTTNALTPSAVSAGISFQAIGVGSNYTCGLATTGLAYCWGWNDGFADSRPWNNGVSINSHTPVAIPGGIQFGSLSVGVLHACGVSVSPAQGYCWLSNQSGEIGNGLDPSDGPTGYYTPQAVR